MMEVLLNEFNVYLNDYNDTQDINALKTEMLVSAQSLVERFLGYTLGEAETEETYTWINRVSFGIMLPKPCEISEIKINGDVVTNYLTHGIWYIKDKDNLYRDYKNAEVEITGYWNLQPTPEIVKIVILKIASLMYMETNKRIGISGVQLPDGMGHQYISYTNYSKHLAALNPYRAPYRFEIGKTLGIPATAIEWTNALQVGGVPATASTSDIILMFNKNPSTLTLDDITVTGATKVSLSGSGTIRSLAITDITVADGESIDIAIASPSGYTLSGSPKSVTVYVGP